MSFVLILQNDPLKRKVLIHSRRMSLQLSKSSEFVAASIGETIQLTKKIGCERTKKENNFEQNFIITLVPFLCLDIDNIETTI